jgi:hypothetical protein
MSLVPVLTLGFYLLYLAKSSILKRRYTPVVAILSFVCFAFTGFSWTENHLLSMAKSAWAQIYESGSMTFISVETVSRFSIWFAASFPIWVVAVLLQFSKRPRDETIDRASRRAALTGIIALIFAGGLASANVAVLHPHTQAYLLDPFARPYMIGGIIGVMLQLFTFAALIFGRRPTRSLLTLASIGVVLAAIGAAIAREAIRARALEIALDYQAHVRIGEAEGVVLFVLIALVNAALIGACIRIVRKKKIFIFP